MKRFLWTFAAVLFIVAAGSNGFLPAESEKPMQAGIAASVNGKVKITAFHEKNSRRLEKGKKIFTGDQIETGRGGQLQILLLDQTVFSLGPSSAVTMDEFIFDPRRENGKIKASLLKGIFRIVSGKIAHQQPENMAVDLPVGSIGFRGTRVAGMIDGQKTTVVFLGPVGAGSIYVTNKVNGNVVGVSIDKAGNATVVNGPNIAPAAVFQASEEDLSKIVGALEKQNEKHRFWKRPRLKKRVLRKNSPKKTMSAQQLLNLLNAPDDPNQKSTAADQNQAQDPAKDSAKASGG